MHTDDLIKQLADQAEPVASKTVTNRLIMTTVAGIGAALVLQMMTVGARADITDAWAAVVFKLAFCLTVVAIWVGYLRSAISPTAGNRTLLVVAFAALALIAVVAAFAPFDLAGLQGCASKVTLLSAPALAGLMWAARQGAPTNLALTGFAVGIGAGAMGACAYALGCLADEPATNAFRYGAAILLNGALGLAIGRFALRW